MLNKQFRTAGIEWSSGLGVRHGYNIPSHQKLAWYEMFCQDRVQCKAFVNLVITIWVS
jgi:hypothetical protein